MAINPKPSIGQLKAWREQEVTLWVMKQLINRFPGYRDLLPVNTENMSAVNYRAGTVAVLEAIEILAEKSTF